MNRWWDVVYSIMLLFRSIYFLGRFLSLKMKFMITSASVGVLQRAFQNVKGPGVRRKKGSRDFFSIPYDHVGKKEINHTI